MKAIKDFLADLVKEVIQPGNEMNRQTFIDGYAAHLQSREDAAVKARENAARAEEVHKAIGTFEDLANDMDEDMGKFVEIAQARLDELTGKKPADEETGDERG